MKHFARQLQRSAKRIKLGVESSVAKAVIAATKRALQLVTEAGKAAEEAAAKATAALVAATNDLAAAKQKLAAVRVEQSDMTDSDELEDSCESGDEE